jgi:UDP-N-acetylmuramate dehydrogenase
LLKQHFVLPDQRSPRTMRQEMLSILRERKRKFPQKLPNCGSVFVSDPAMYAEYGPPGAVIEKLGLKGLTYGGAQVSPQHANFVVNTGQASAQDVLQVVTHVRDAVLEHTGYNMRPEGKFVRPDGTIVSLC